MSIMAIVKNSEGKIVKVMQTNKKPGSKMFGYCGQDLKNGVFAVYVDSIGICSVEKSNEPETVVITGVLVKAGKIRQTILSDFTNSKKLAVMVESAEDKRVLEVLEVPVNTQTIDLIMECLELNNANGKFGVCIRNVNDNIEKLATIGNKVLSFPADRLEEIAEEYHATGSNNGNFSEYLLSGNIKDIIDRFRAKKNDVYIKLEPFKTKRAWELKTTLKYTNKGKKSGASNTNFLYHEKIKK